MEQIKKNTIFGHVKEKESLRSVQLQDNVQQHTVGYLNSNFFMVEADEWTVLIRISLTLMSRRHLIRGVVAVPGSGSQALQAWSSPAQGTATESQQASTL